MLLSMCSKTDLPAVASFSGESKIQGANMNSQVLGTNQPTLKPATSLLPIPRKVHRSIALFVFLLSLFLPALVQAAFGPPSQLLQNADFEQGTMNSWGWQGGGWAGVESCCGQHNTAFWGYNGGNPYPNPSLYDTDNWNGYMDLAGGWTQLYQNRQVNSGQKYRLSSWFFTNGVTALLRRWSPTTGYVACASTVNTAHTPLSCEFTASATENVSFILETTGSSGQWAVSDDWAVTPVVQAPRISQTYRWSALPVLYYIDTGAYPMRTDIAAWGWNNAMGRTMLQRTSASNAPIKVTAGYRGLTSYLGRVIIYPNLPPESQIPVTIDLNKSFLDQWKDPPFRYGFEAREGVIAHEFGHALGLGHVSGNNCQLMNLYGEIQTWYCNAYTASSGDVAGMRSIYP